MKLLFLGDIVGKPGRAFVADRLRQIRQERQIDVVIANGENAAGGSGITAAIAEELLGAGVDAITLGDHVWDQRGFSADIDRLEMVCRPANLPEQCPGRRVLVLTVNGYRLAVFTVLGRSFMKIDADCPFRTADALLASLRDEADGVFVEFHGETTAEKVAFGWYLDGRALAVVGTHTHIPTADARVLPRGTAYHTDAGMCGPYESVLGREIQPIIGRYLDGMPRRWPVAEGDLRLCGTEIVIDTELGMARQCHQWSHAHEPETSSDRT